MKIGYGHGDYAPLGDPGEDVGDLIDWIDPLGIRKIPGAVKGAATKKVDTYVDKKTAQATTAAGKKVEAGVRRAIDDASSKALAYGGGAVLLAALIGGGIYVHHHAQTKKAGR